MPVYNKFSNNNNNNKNHVRFARTQLSGNSFSERVIVGKHLPWGLTYVLIVVPMCNIRHLSS